MGLIYNVPDSSSLELTGSTKLRPYIITAIMAATRHEGARVDVSSLNEPLNFVFSGKEAKNRFLEASMSERLATWESGWDPNTPRSAASLLLSSSLFTDDGAKVVSGWF